MLSKQILIVSFERVMLATACAYAEFSVSVRRPTKSVKLIATIIGGR